MASMEAVHPEDMQPWLCSKYGSISAKDWKEISWALRDLSGHTLRDALEADSESDTQFLSEVDEGECSTHADIMYFRSIVSKESKSASGSSKPPPKHLKDGCILCFFQPNKEHLYGHKAQSADDTQTLKLGNNKSTTIIDVTSDAKDIYVPEVEGTSLDHAFQFSSQNYIDGHIAYPEYSHRRQSIASTEEEVDSAAETLFSQIPHKISHVASDKPLNVVTASKLTSEFLTANQALVERQANQGHDNITHQEDKMKILKIAEKFLAAEAKRYEERITDAQVSELRSHEEETASLQPRENKTLASATVATTSLSDISSTSAETTALKISKTQRRREERKRARMLKAEKLGKTFITSVEI